MSRASKVLITAALTMVCAFAFSVSSASATAGHGGACGFTGLAGGITGGQNPGGVESVVTDLSRTNQPGGNVLLDTDSGTYNFSGSGTCLISNASGPPFVDAVHISSQGSYTNTICGTGSATSSNQTLVRRTNASGPVLVDNVSYSINFVAGNGALSISSARDTSDGNTGSGGGYVHIQPTQGGNCVTTDVAAFDVAGAFAVVESP